MIIDSIFNIILSFFNTIIDIIPTVDINMDFSLIDNILEFIKMACFFFPIGNLLPIIVFNIGIVTYKFVINLLRTIWDIVPLV